MESKTRNELWEVEHSNTNKTWYSPQDSEGCLLNKVSMGMLARGHNCFPIKPLPGSQEQQMQQGCGGDS